jgi:hypothetical protein
MKRERRGGRKGRVQGKGLRKEKGRKEEKKEEGKGEEFGPPMFETDRRLCMLPTPFFPFLLIPPSLFSSLLSPLKRGSGV